MTTRRWLVVAVAAVAVLLIAGRALAGVYADYLWYDALGANALWRARAAAIVELRLGSAIVSGFFAFANLYVVRKSIVSLVLPRRIGNLEFDEEVSNRYLLVATIALSIILGALLAMSNGDWLTLVAARWGHSFGIADPYFGTDLSFFVFWLPFENTLWNWGFMTVLVTTVTVIVLYALTPSLKWQGGTLYASAYVRRHFTVLIGVVLLFLAWSFRLDMYGLLSAGSGPDGAFSWVDHRIAVPGDLVLAAATLGAALVALWSGFSGQFRLAMTSVVAVVVLALVVREAAPLVGAHLGNDVTRLARERPYLDTRGAYTRRAFGVDAILRVDSGVSYATPAAALPWTSAWDAPALVRAVDETRSTDDVARTLWRVQPSGLVAGILKTPPPNAQGAWTAAYVAGAQADATGAPVQVGATGAEAGFAPDVPLDPPVSFPDAPAYALITDSLDHTAGTPLESLPTRLAYAWSLQNFHIMSSEVAQQRPTLLVRPDVRERVARFAPFFVEGRTVRPLIVGEAVYWSVDLYSVSDDYPLSRRIPMGGDDRGYVRHAAVALVHGGTGDIVVVPDSAPDPITSIWIRHLPSIFGTWSALPAALRPLVAPATDGLSAQAAAFGRYGSGTDTSVVRHVPEITGADPQLQSDAPAIVLPHSPSVDASLPLVDEADRVRGLLIGIGGGGGGRRALWYPLDKTGPRWGTVLDRLRAADSASHAGLRDGPLARGRVRVIPVRSSVAFIQPVYRWRQQAAPTLDHLAVLFNDTVSVVPASALGAGNAIPAGMNGRAGVLYGQMRDALLRGDWTAFGRAFDALGKLLGAPLISAPGARQP